MSGRACILASVQWIWYVPNITVITTNPLTTQTSNIISGLHLGFFVFWGRYMWEVTWGKYWHATPILKLVFDFPALESYIMHTTHWASQLWTARHNLPSTLYPCGHAYAERIIITKWLEYQQDYVRFHTLLIGWRAGLGLRAIGMT